jgi:hypothetical protein
MNIRRSFNVTVLYYTNEPIVRDVVIIVKCYFLYIVQAAELVNKS